MPQRWTHTAAFRHFGTEPRNVQWSWSARSEDGQTVVVTLWQDGFARKNGRLVYIHKGFDPRVQRRPGFGELMDNLAWARDHCEGRFKVIVAIARDKNADPRAIAECHPSKMTMRLEDLDPSTGAFVAVAEGI